MVNLKILSELKQKICDLEQEIIKLKLELAAKK
jgi:uncharacterized small protein (DUF1192 family)